MNRVKFKLLAERVIKDYIAENRKTLEDAKRCFRLHILPAFGERRAVTITGGDVADFKDNRLAQGASRGEVNRELTLVRRAFSLHPATQPKIHEEERICV